MGNKFAWAEGDFEISDAPESEQQPVQISDDAGRVVVPQPEQERE